MKTTLTLIASLLLLIGNGSALRAQTDVPPEGARYGVRSAIIKKTASNEMGKGIGEFTIYIDDYGAKEAIEARMDEYGISDHTITIRYPERDLLLIVEPEERTATWIEWKSDTPYDYRHLTPKKLRNYGLIEEGSEDVQGKTCRVFKQTYNDQTVVTIYAWEGIELKKDTKTKKAELNTSENIESIEVNVPIPQEKFEVPKGYKILHRRGGE